MTQQFTAREVRERAKTFGAGDIYRMLCAYADRLEADEKAVPVKLEYYDAGLLNDFGGGNVIWWWDYMRDELGRAHSFYQSQVDGFMSAPSDAERLVTNEETKMDKTNWHRPNEEMHGKQTSCPKCALEFKTMLHPFCQHHECPVRDWEDAQKPQNPIDTRPSLLERLRIEADHCRNETTSDVAALLDEAADYIQRHNYK